MAVTFKEVLAQVVDWLQQDRRVSFRALQRQFDIDDDYLKDLKEALLYTYSENLHDDGQGFEWTGDPPVPIQYLQPDIDSESRFQALLPEVTMRLKRERRVTYRELQYLFGLNEVLLDEIRQVLTFKQLARDEHGQGLVWTGESRSSVQPIVAPPATSPASSLTPLVSETPTPSNGPTSSVEAISTDTSKDVSTTSSEPTRTSPEAEHRQLTVMFCDLVGSTDLSGKLDPEHLREVVKAYQVTAAEVVQRYAGHIAQYLGDGLLIYFGFPVAHEDDAQRAVYTGLEIPEAMANLNTRLNTDYGVELAVRIGIHTGPVVVGEMGGGSRHENLALGETPNIAARLEGLAQPNTTVISAVTAQLVQRSFVLEELGPHELKGVPEPMILYRVASLREVEPDDPEVTMTGGFNTLVGRDEEIGLLLRRWEQSKEGLGQVVLISGEAGIGKSSLVDGLRVYVRQEGLTRTTLRCSPYHTNSALYPIIEHVQRALGWQPDDPVEKKLVKLEQGLQGTSLPLTDAVPLLAVLLSLPLPEGRYPALPLTPQQQRQQTQDILVAWLLDEAERQPVLAVWEDLHWADPSTLEVLGLLIDQAPTVSMLHVLTFRPEFEPPWPNRSHMTPIALNRLERPQVEALIVRLAGDKGLPADVVQHIVGKTDGVPLYVEELTKMLLASELLQADADRYVLTGPLLSVAIPDTLQDSLMARLDQMNTAKEVAQLGAVIGREFAYDLLQAISPQDEATLRAGLMRLVEAELLYRRGRPPQARYLFKHALIQDAAYQSLLKSTRQHVHQQIAGVMSERFRDTVDTHPELLAHHYTEAGLHQEAIPYWYRAGQRAVEGSAHVEAIAHLSKGLQGLETLPDTPDRRRQELDLQVVLGPALMAIKGQASPDVEHAYARARELCQQIGETPQLFPVLRGLTLHYMMRGELQTAKRLGKQLYGLAESQQEPVPLMYAHYMLGVVLFWRGEPVAAHSHHTQALALYNSQAHRDSALSYGVDLGVVSGAHLMYELWQLGYPDQALQHSQSARKPAQEGAHPYSLALSLLITAVLHQCRHEASLVHEHTEALTSLATEQGFVLWLTWGTVLHGWARAMQGESAAGIAEMREGIAADLDIGAKMMRPYFLGLLAEAYWESGQPETGLPLVNEALTVMDGTEACFYGAELHRLKGALLIHQATPDSCEAVSSFHQALDMARAQQAKSWELRAATSLARLWQSQDKRQEAYDLLAPVYEWFTEGFDTAYLQDAKLLLDELKV